MDEEWMRHALALGRAGLGRTAPNPSVGCVIVRDGVMVGEARSADDGRPHAETQALAQAGDKARDATVYVTLEPCAHTGKTPPCANALIQAGVARVVMACTDPDPRVAGRGAAMLRAAGIEVTEGVCEAEAREAHRGFFLTLSHKRPLVSLKLATSLDARIAAADGSNQWITGAESRERVHVLRAQHDAVVTGSGTVLADNPMLTVRLGGHDGRQPMRIVLDRRGRVSDPSLHLLSDGHETEIIRDYSDMDALLERLVDMGLTRIMVEAGKGVASAFLKSGHVDYLYWFRAPIVLGERGLPALGDLDIGSLDAALRLHRTHYEPLGDDLLEIYQRKE